MASRWMQAKQRQRRAYLKKKPAGKFNPYLFRDTHGNPKDVAVGENLHDKDWLDDIQPDKKIQRAWIDEHRKAQKKAQLLKPRPGVKDIWYKISEINWPNMQLEMWFSGNRYRLRYVRDSREFVSTIYPSRETLMSDFKEGLVVWDITNQEKKT